MLNKLIEYVLSSSTIREFKTEKGHRTRGTINLWLNKPYGIGLSSSVSHLIDAKLGVIIQDYSRPGLIGTIKKDGIAAIGDIRLLPNTTAILEEFQEAKKDARSTMLSLMEDHRFTRTLGFEVLKPDRVIKEGFGFIAEGTRIDIYLKASYIISSMAFKTSSTLDLALISRCIPIYLDTSKEEQTMLFIEGKKIDVDINKIKKRREELSELSVLVPEKTRIDVSEMYDYTDIRPENIPRAMWDYVRIAYLESYNMGVNEIDIDVIDSVQWLTKIQQLGYAKQSLTKAAYEVYLYLLKQEEPMRAVKIAKSLKFSREYTSRMISELVKRRLVSKTNVSNEVVYYVE